MLNIPPSYQKVKKNTNNKKTTKNGKGLEKLFAIKLKLLVITLGFFGQIFFYLHPCEGTGKIIFYRPIQLT